MDTILTWDMVENSEREGFDITGEYKLLWDSGGSTYIVHNGKVEFTKERCGIKSFDIEDFEAMLSSNRNAELSDDKGHRIDH